MKPVSYQPMHHGHPLLGLDHLLGAPKVMHCEKCGFASRDSEVLHRHRMEHVGTRFYCFYCNNVSFSQAELNVHLKQHTANYPFKCQVCGQGYMRRLCLVKHIERLHGKVNGQGIATSAFPKNMHVPISGALPSFPSADPSAVRPAVKLTIPNPVSTVARLSKDEFRGKMVTLKTQNIKNGEAELTSPVNRHIQHHRALTVSLPEEVTIPAGCMVELVEVKTVNGTKELKLRLVSQQENEASLKEKRSTFSLHNTLGKPFSSTLNNTNTNMRMSTFNGKQCQTKEHDPSISDGVNISQVLQNPSSKDKAGTKRTSQEMTDLECFTVIPPKMSKEIQCPERAGHCKIQTTRRKALNLDASSSIKFVSSGHASSKGKNLDIRGGIIQRTLDGDIHYIVEHSMSSPPLMGSETRVSQIVPMAVKCEPEEMGTKNKAAEKKSEEEESFILQKFKCTQPSDVQSTAGLPVKAPGRYVSITANPPHIMPRGVLNQPLSVSQYLREVDYNLSKSSTSLWTRDVESKDRTGGGDIPKPEGFPVISSVFSLSQQPEVVQDTMQPLVMALQGVVMNRKCSVGTSPDSIEKTNKSVEPKQEKPDVDGCPQMVQKHSLFCNDQSLKKKTEEPVKIGRSDKSTQHCDRLTEADVDIKKESMPNGNQKVESQPETSSSAAHQQPPQQQPVPSTVSHKDISITAHPLLNALISESKEDTILHRDASVTAHPLQNAPAISKSEDDTISHGDVSVSAHPLKDGPDIPESKHDITSKFLTVSLKRIHVGLWECGKKRPTLKVLKHETHGQMGGLTDSTVIYPMPLKVDQLVKQPGPNQPVVVLNHPKPQVPKWGAATDMSVTSIGASEVVPKCRILKMRLSKVMGQKYAVIGCTVGVIP